MSNTADRCPQCDGTGIEPGSGDYEHTACMVNLATQEPCSVCHGTSAGYECDCDLHAGDLAQLRSSLAMAREDVRAAYAERDEMWERKATALRERDEARQMFKLMCQQVGVFEGQLDLMTQMRDSERKRADDLVAERDALKAALNTPTPTTRTETP
jgi:hypothetical protein